MAGVYSDTEHQKEIAEQLKSEKLKSEILSSMIKNEEDPIEILKNFAEEIRAFLDCDQIIYRDLNKVRFMFSSPKIKKTEEVSIKSFLSSDIYCDDKVVGSFIISYVLKSHEFSDIERATFEEFCRTLSLSISRYQAKKNIGELSSIKKMLDMTFALSDQFDPIIILNPETGEYDWLMSVAKDVVDNTSMTMHGNDIYKNIGIDSASIIHEEDREQFKNFYTKKNMMKIAQTGEVQEIENRWFIQTENRYRWKYNKAVRMLTEDGKAYVVIGVIDTTEQKEKEESYNEQKMLLEQNKSLFENSARFFALEDTFESLYDVELETGKYVSFARGEFYTTNISNKLVSPDEFFDNMQENIDRVVYKEDREQTFKVQQREEIIKELAKSDHFDHYYRIITNKGLVWLKMRIVYKDATKKNVIIGVFNAEEEMLIKQREELIRTELEQTNARLFALEDNFESLYDVDLETGFYTFFVKGDFYKNNVVDKLTVPEDYFEQLRQNIDAVIYKEDQDGLYKALSRKKIKEELNKNDHYDYYYRIILDKDIAWFKLRVVYKDANKKNIIIGVFNAAKEMAQKEKEENESKKLISSIASSYNIVYTVNMSDDTFKLIRMDNDIIGKGEEFKSFSQAKKFFLNLIPKSDKKIMEEELNYETIRKKLKKNSSYSIEYRVPIKGAMVWHEMYVTRIDGDLIILAFANKDLEITKKHLEDRRYNEYFALYEVDLDTGMLKVVKDSPWYEIDITGTAMPYESSMRKFAETLDGEAKEFFERLTDIEVIKKDFAHEDKRTYAYRSNNVGDKLWVDCTSYVTLRHEDGTPAMFTFGFSLVDSLGVYRQELQNKYKDALNVVNEEKHRNDLLHDIIHSGKWSFRIGKDDKVISADYSEEVMRVINNDFNSGVDEWVKLLHPDDKDVTLKAFRATIEDHTCNTPYDVAFRMKDRNGEYNWFHSAGRIIRNADGTGEFFGIHINITSQIEEQLKQQSLLEDARIAADAANQSKSNFLFNMSHDIRTPMNAIRGFTTMAKKHLGDADKIKEYLDKIDISGEQLLKLINQVLEMARIESGKIEFQRKPVNIQDEYNSLITILKEQAETTGINLKHSINKVKHFNIVADEARMSSVMMNIIGNAMKYTPEGGTVEIKFTELNSKKSGYATFLFTVADTGIGMSKEYLEKLYEPFSREKNTTVSQIQGTGLGLSIVKSIIDLIYGKIEVESELGKGTKFDITVDLRIDDNVAEKKEEEIATVIFSGKRLLLVEDNEMNREIAKDILEEQGFILEVAKDGDEAIEKVKKYYKKREYNHYDFILMDVQMPRMNGYEATKIIRQMEEKKGIHVPIIAMTANAFEEDKQNALAAGMDEHLAKPIEIQKLFKTIAKFIS